MKVLLCTPYNLSNTKPGGISIWARNIMEYYHNNPQKLTIDIYKCNRSTFITGDMNVLKRFFWGIVDYFQIVIGIFNAVRKSDYDVVHINTTASFGTIKDIILCLLLKRKNVKVFLHYHFGGIPILCEQRNIGWRLLKLSIKNAHKVILMDNQSYQVLKNNGFKNIIEIPNPYSPCFEDKVYSLQKKIERKKRQILFLGRVSRKKGIYELVRACRTISDINLRVVGGYDEIDKQNLLDIAHHGEWIEFVGPVHNDEVIKELLSCELLVMPTYTEGFPNVVLEAMITKTPLIVTPVGAIPEMLDFDGNPCAVFIRPQNVDDIIESIEYMLGNRELQRNISDRAFERVKTVYNLSQVGDMLYSTWNS